MLKKSALKTVLLIVCGVGLCSFCATLRGGPAPEAEENLNVLSGEDKSNLLYDYLMRQAQVL